jgi:cell division protein FtsQ
MRPDRFRRARKKSGILSMFRSIAAFIFILTVAIIVYIYLPQRISLLPIRNIVFMENRHLTDDELKSLSGIKINDSLIAVSNKKISQNLLKSSWIRSVSVRKELPDTLSIVIAEAVPFALLDMNSRLFLIDDKGKLLEELKGDSVPFLPIIRGDPFKEREGFSEALNLAKLMTDKKFPMERDHIEIHTGKPHELTVTIDGTMVKMGAGRYEEKLDRLIVLEEEIKSRDIHVDYIDLRFENKAFVKPISSEAVE